MQAKVFSKSQNIPPTINLLFSASRISLISLQETFNVDELLLQSYCWFTNTLFWFIHWYDLHYLTFLKMLVKNKLVYK